MSDSVAGTLSHTFSDASLKTEDFSAANVSVLIGTFMEQILRGEATSRTSEFWVASVDNKSSVATIDSKRLDDIV